MKNRENNKTKKTKTRKILLDLPIELHAKRKSEAALRMINFKEYLILLLERD